MENLLHCLFTPTPAGLPILFKTAPAVDALIPDYLRLLEEGKGGVLKAYPVELLARPEKGARGLNGTELEFFWAAVEHTRQLARTAA